MRQVNLGFASLNPEDQFAGPAPDENEMKLAERPAIADPALGLGLVGRVGLEIGEAAI